MQERIMIVLALFGLILLLPLAARSLGVISRRKAQTAATTLTLDPQAPTVLYFWSQECHQCRVAQAPTLDRLAATSNIKVIPINAVAEREMADKFGVMTLPTTIVLAPDGAVRAVNHGFAPLAKLQAQLT